MELLVDSNCFLEKRGCSHAQLIIESRQSIWVEHVLTAQNKMVIWTCGILRELYILDTRYIRVRLMKLSSVC